MLSRLRKQVQATAQRFALGSIGALMSLAGLGFFSASALMLLLTLTDPIMACAIMGSAFLGIGLLLMAAARSPRETAKHHASAPIKAPTEDMPPIAAAFMQGMAQGMAEGRKH